MATASKGWAVITGASAGLGVEFARQLSKRGYDVVLTARRRDRLEQLAKELESSRGVKTMVIECDLSAPGASATIVRALEERSIVPEVLVNNAGIGAHGPAIELPVARATAMIDLNVTSLTELSLVLGAKMAARGSGGIVNVSSTASFQPSPHFAVYAATKAFVTSFSMALACELAPRGVRVVAHCPGPTRTEFNDVNDVRAAAGEWVYMSAERCVAIGLRALERGRWLVVTGLFNKIGAFIARRSPLWIVTRVTGIIMRPSRPSRALPAGGAG